MLTTSLIIDNLKKDESINYKKLCRLLKITKKSDKEKLSIALNALEKLDIIRKNENDEFQNINSNNHITAKIRCSSKGYCFAVRDNLNEDIYIKENLLNYAWNGDKVLVRIIKEGIKRRSPEGIVDCILERENRILLSKVEVEGDQVYGIPIDDRILAKVKLPSEDKKYLYNSDKKNIVKIEIDSFPIAQFEGIGHVIKELNLNNNEEDDNEFVLSKNNINLSKKESNLEIIEPEITERIDNTPKNSFMFKSWEHENSPLLPMFQVEIDDNSNYKLWIHVSSLAERINFNNKDLKDYFKNNYESFPFNNKWKSFLDEKLLKISKFKVGKSNKAISLCLSLSKKFEIEDWSFHLTEVNCSAIIENKHLKALNNRKRNGRLTSRVLKPLEKFLDEIELIITISKSFRRNQLKKGKVEISNEVNNIETLNELYFHNPCEYNNDYLAPLNYQDIQTFISPILFEADTIWFQHSKSLNIKNISFLSNNLNDLNVNDLIRHSQVIDSSIELDQEGNLTLNKLLNLCRNDNQKHIISKYLVNNLKNNNAILYNNEIQSNNSLFYQSPWTLPSKDYINLVNQYNIYIMFKFGKKIKKNNKKVNINEKNSWENINSEIFNASNLKISNLLFESITIEKFNSHKRKLNSYLSNLINIKQMREAENLIGKEFEGLIMTVQSYGLFVELPELLVEGLVHVSTLNDDWYEYRSRQNLLIGRKSKNTYRVGDLIKVKIAKVDILKYQIDLEITS
tara:strand:+ start:257 stop:2476 length:2220 start_codon:yes stop_codon:yes gene_type:complete